MQTQRLALLQALHRLAQEPEVAAPLARSLCRGLASLYTQSACPGFVSPRALAPRASQLWREPSALPRLGLAQRHLLRQLRTAAEGERWVCRVRR